ncbi:uncharacterized protein LOC106655914 [Trichogramma pretiosum]|uniref:uncharacterized protein LOC106655914 n=1 Tax=Trichogramma pretiosum TaxID=7493 RepID=UPI0006C96158|nr:uncharacterized protein LOC106655914 [Trichogramma pretiosum]
MKFHQIVAVQILIGILICCSIAAPNREYKEDTTLKKKNSAAAIFTDLNQKNAPDKIETNLDFPRLSFNIFSDFVNDHVPYTTDDKVKRAVVNNLGYGSQSNNFFPHKKYYFLPPAKISTSTHFSPTITKLASLSDHYQINDVDELLKEVDKLYDVSQKSGYFSSNVSSQNYTQIKFQSIETPKSNTETLSTYKSPISSQYFFSIHPIATNFNLKSTEFYEKDHNENNQQYYARTKNVGSSLKNQRDLNIEKYPNTKFENEIRSIQKMIQKYNDEKSTSIQPISYVHSYAEFVEFPKVKPSLNNIPTKQHNKQTTFSEEDFYSTQEKLLSVKPVQFPIAEDNDFNKNARVQLDIVSPKILINSSRNKIIASDLIRDSKEKKINDSNLINIVRSFLNHRYNTDQWLNLKSSATQSVLDYIGSKSFTQKEKTSSKLTPELNYQISEADNNPHTLLIYNKNPSLIPEIEPMYERITNENVNMQR